MLQWFDWLLQRMKQHFFQGGYNMLAWRVPLQDPKLIPTALLRIVMPRILHVYSKTPKT